MAIHADPDEVREAAVAVREARLTVVDCASRVESSVCRVHAQSWQGERADAVLGEILTQMERLRAAAEEMAALTARIERYALALDAYVAEGSGASAITFNPDAKTTVTGAGGSSGTRLAHHRAVAALAKQGVEFYAIDVSAELDRGVKGAATVALVEHRSPRRRQGSWRVQQGTTVASVGVKGDASLGPKGPSVDVGVDVVIAERRVEVSRQFGGHEARVEARAGLAFHLGFGLSTDFVALRLPLLSVSFSLRRAEGDA